jgi:hypothetical protein
VPHATLDRHGTEEQGGLLLEQDDDVRAANTK